MNRLICKFFFCFFFLFCFCLNAQTQNKKPIPFNVKIELPIDYGGAEIEIQNLETGDYDLIFKKKTKKNIVELKGKMKNYYGLKPNGLASLVIKPNNKQQMIFYPLILENNEIKLKFHSFYSSEISGSDIQERHNLYKTLEKDVLKYLSFRLNLDTIKDTLQKRIEIENASQKLDSLFSIYLNNLKKLIIEDGHESKFLYYMVAHQSKFFIAQKDFSFLSKVCQASKEILNPTLNRKLCNASVNPIAIDSIAPDFQLKDNNGNFVQLSQFKRKYVFIDFWASWCIPCRKQFPNIKSIYSEIDKSKVEFLSVSIDDDIDRWKKAIKKDELIAWPQLIDNQGLVKSDYLIESIPFNLILDPKGKIVAIDVRPDKIADFVK